MNILASSLTTSLSHQVAKKETKIIEFSPSTSDFTLIVQLSTDLIILAAWYDHFLKKRQFNEPTVDTDDPSSKLSYAFQPFHYSNQFPINILSFYNRSLGI